MPIPKTDLSYSNFTFKLHGGEDNLKQTITFGCLQKKKGKSRGQGIKQYTPK